MTAGRAVTWVLAIVLIAAAIWVVQWAVFGAIFG